MHERKLNKRLLKQQEYCQYEKIRKESRRPIPMIGPEAELMELVMGRSSVEFKTNNYASLQREFDHNCGKIGKFWEPKEPIDQLKDHVKSKSLIP